MGFAVFARTFLIDVAVIDHLVFVGWQWIDIGEQVMPVLRLALFGGEIRDVTLTELLHNNLGIILLSPFLDVRLIEPGLVSWHEMLPLQDLQRLLLGAGTARDDDTSADARGQGRRACRVEQLPSCHPVSRAVHLRSSMSL